MWNNGAARGRNQLRFHGGDANISGVSWGCCTSVTHFNSLNNVLSNATKASSTRVNISEQGKQTYLGELYVR